MYAASGMFSGMPSAQILEILNRTYRLAEENGDLQKMSALFNKFGYLRIATGMGDFDAAENDYQRGLALSREIGNLSTEEMLLSNLGVCFTNKGDYRQALETLKSCLAMGESYPTYWRYLVSRHHLGALFMQMGRLDDARAELTYASDQLSAQGNRHFEVKARCDLGLLYHLAGEDERAADELTHVLTLIEGHGDLRFEALVSTRLGYALEATGQLDDAGQMYAHGYDLHRQMAQDYYALNALAGSARVANQQDDTVTALTYAKTIWETIADRETDATVETARTLRTCYTIFRQQNDPRWQNVLDAACTQLQRRVDTIDSPAHVTRFWQLADHRFFREEMRRRASAERDNETLRAGSEGLRDSEIDSRAATPSWHSPNPQSPILLIPHLSPLQETLFHTHETPKKRCTRYPPAIRPFQRIESQKTSPAQARPTLVSANTCGLCRGREISDRPKSLSPRTST